jgi:GNAT superfamily N-acetyltransferase
MVSSFFAHEATGFIADLYVQPGCRNRGVGRRLVAALGHWFAEQGFHQMEWHVSAQNHEAQAFWQSLGATPLLIRMRATWPPEAS